MSTDKTNWSQHLGWRFLEEPKKTKHVRRWQKEFLLKVKLIVLSLGLIQKTCIIERWKISRIWFKVEIIGKCIKYFLTWYVMVILGFFIK